VWSDFRGAAIFDHDNFDHNRSEIFNGDNKAQRESIKSMVKAVQKRFMTHFTLLSLAFSISADHD
jgi:hypothetical protein